MAKRYERIFSLQERLYAKGAPVILEAGALLHDNESKKKLAQLKLLNIQPKVIKAVTVSIQPKDTVGQPLEGIVTHQYLDLNAKRDFSFGTQVPILLPDAARAYDAGVTQVIFADNTIWDADNSPWEPLPEQTRLTDVYSDPELVKQYKIVFGDNCWWQYREDLDLWRCACGAWNRQNEAKCHKCEKAADAIQDPDLAELTTAKDLRLEEEAKQAEAAKKRRAAQIAKAKKWATVVVPLVIVLFIAGKFVAGYMDKTEYYDYGLDMIEEGEYEYAMDIFTELGDFKDSTDQIETIQALLQAQKDAAIAAEYEEACSLLEEGSASAAIDLFEALGSYKDSPEMLATAKLQLEINEFWRTSAPLSKDSDEYTIVDGATIEELLVGEWLIQYNLPYKYAYTATTFIKNGVMSSETFSAHELIGAGTWNVKENLLHITISEGVRQATNNPEYIVELYQVTDDVYIACSAGENTATWLYVKSDSIWAERFRAFWD